MELQPVTGQLFILNGEVQEVTAEQPIPGLLVQPAPPRAARSRENDLLFVHLTLSGPFAETAVLYQDILIVISKTFYQANGSVTGDQLEADSVNKEDEVVAKMGVSHSVKARTSIKCTIFFQK